jgi:hypothetical protein
LIINFLTVELNAQVFSNGFNTIGGNMVGIRTNSPSSSLTVEPGCSSNKRDSPLNIKYCNWTTIGGVVIPTPLSAIFVSQDGKVGLRTENPAEVLDVHGNAKIGNNGWTSLTLDGTGNNDWMFNAHNDEESLNIRTTPNGSSNWSSYVMVLKRNSGNVGIGVANPAHKLHVAGSGRFTGDLQTNSNFVVLGTSSLQGKVEIGDNTIASGVHNTSDVMLTVDGHAIFKKVVVTQSNWADFVFADDYELPALSDVEEFIRTNKHLPNIPKEQEVIENGISLGDMDALLLQKIEELTLYMIQLQKKNDELEAIVNSLK